MSSSETNSSMTSGELLSTFMDGEMDSQAAKFFARRLIQDGDLQSDWARWHLVRGYLRDGDGAAALAAGSADNAPDLVERVRAALTDDAVPAAESTAVPMAWAQRLLRPVASAAIAATAAMTAIIGVNQFYNGGDTEVGGVTPQATIAASPSGTAPRDTTPTILNSPTAPIEAVPVGLANGPALREDPRARARLEAYLLRHYTHARLNGGSFVGYMSNINREARQAQLNDTQQRGNESQRGQDARNTASDATQAHRE